jgi:hypothetical protein
VGILRRVRVSRDLVVWRAVTGEQDPAARQLVGYWAKSEDAAAAAFNRWLREAPSAWTMVSGTEKRQPMPEVPQAEGIRPAARRH